MVSISQRQLRNDSGQIMDRVEAGESFTVTRHGNPVAQLIPLKGPRQAVPTAELIAAFAGLSPIDYVSLRAEADALFQDGGDRID